MVKDSINKIKEYFISMEMYQGRWVICVRFRPKWGAYSSDDGRIKVGPDEKQPDVWWYCANNDDVEVDEIIDLIDETVQTNMEAIKKVELFKQKANELKQLFSDENTSFKKLQTLKFVFDTAQETAEDKAKMAKAETKRKTATKKDLMTQVGEVIQEHDVFTSPSTTILEQDEPPKKRKSGKTAPNDNVVTLKPGNMSKDDIDSLRG